MMAAIACGTWETWIQAPIFARHFADGPGKLGCVWWFANDHDRTLLSLDTAEADGEGKEGQACLPVSMYALQAAVY